MTTVFPFNIFFCLFVFYIMMFTVPFNNMQRVICHCEVQKLFLAVTNHDNYYDDDQAVLKLTKRIEIC